MVAHDLPPCVTKHYNDVVMSVMASQITSLMIVYSTVYSGANQRKDQSSASMAFVWGIHRWLVNSPHKGSVTRKMFPFDNVIMHMEKIADIWEMIFWNAFHSRNRWHLGDDILKCISFKENVGSLIQISWVLFIRVKLTVRHRDHFVCAPIQWDITLHPNIASHWLGTYTKWSLKSTLVQVMAAI